MSSSVQEQTQCLPPSESQFLEVAKTVAICSPMGMAAFAAAAPGAAMSLSTLLGRAGSQVALRANQAGIILTIGQTLLLFGKGMASIKQCQEEEIEYKKSIIQEVIELGQIYERALDQAAPQIGRLNANQRAGLTFPAHRMTEEAIQRWTCGELVQFAEYKKGRFVSIYSDMTEGKMVNVPINVPEKHRINESDQRLIDLIIESLQCLPPREYVEGACMVGNFILFGTPLQSKIIERMHRRNGMGPSEPPDTPSQSTASHPKDDFETSTDVSTREAFEEIREKNRRDNDLRAHNYQLQIGQRINVGRRTITVKERLGDGIEGQVYRVEDESGRPMVFKTFNDAYDINFNRNALEKMRGYLGSDSVIKIYDKGGNPPGLLMEYVHGTDLNYILSHPKVPTQTKMRLQIQFEELQRKARMAGQEEPADFNIIVRERDMSLVVIDPF